MYNLPLSAESYSFINEYKMQYVCNLICTGGQFNYFQMKRMVLEKHFWHYGKNTPKMQKKINYYYYCEKTWFLTTFLGSLES